MHVGMILEMASDSLGERVALGPLDGGLTFGELGHRARRAGTWLAAQPGANVVLIDENSPAVPIALFGAAIAGKPFAPMNYRLADDRLRAIVERAAPGDGGGRRSGVAERLEGVAGDRHRGASASSSPPWRTSRSRRPTGGAATPTPPRCSLFTSGTTGEPKAAVLRHLNLASYLVELPGVRRARARTRPRIVSVPPYHIAVGVIGAVHHLHGPADRAARELRSQGVGRSRSASESVTHAMVVPTMLQPHPRRRRAPTGAACRRCGRWPTAGAPCPGRSSSGPWPS